MAHHEVHLNVSTVRNELQEKLKNLKKFEASEEFTKIKAFCTEATQEYEKVIRKLLKARRNKKTGHKAIYSELDLFICNQVFLEGLLEMSKDKSFKQEIQENITNLESHLFLQS